MAVSVLDVTCCVISNIADDQFAFVRRMNSKWRLWEWATSLTYFESRQSLLPIPQSSIPFSFSLVEYDPRHTGTDRGTHKQRRADAGFPSTVPSTVLSRVPSRVPSTDLITEYRPECRAPSRVPSRVSSRVPNTVPSPEYRPEYRPESRVHSRVPSTVPSTEYSPEYRPESRVPSVYRALSRPQGE